MTEDAALALLQRRDLSAQEIDALLREPAIAKSRKALCAIVAHPNTARHTALPNARKLFTFELMAVALQPMIAADLRRFIEDLLAQKVPTLSVGEKLTLAKRGTGRCVAALLLDSEARIVEAALRNPRMTETLLLPALRSDKCPSSLVGFVMNDANWTSRPDVAIALLMTTHITAGVAIALASRLKPAQLQDVLRSTRASEHVKHAIKERLANSVQL